MLFGNFEIKRLIPPNVYDKFQLFSLSFHFDLFTIYFDLLLLKNIVIL